MNERYTVETLSYPYIYDNDQRETMRYCENHEIADTIAAELNVGTFTVETDQKLATEVITIQRVGIGSDSGERIRVTVDGHAYGLMFFREREIRSHIIGALCNLYNQPIDDAGRNGYQIETMLKGTDTITIKPQYTG